MPEPQPRYSRQAVATAQQFENAGRDVRMSANPDMTDDIVQQVLDGGRPVEVYNAQGRLLARHMLEQQGAPMTEANMQRAMATVNAPGSSRRASGAPETSPMPQSAPVIPDDVLLGEPGSAPATGEPGMTPAPEDGGLSAGEAAALGAAGAAVAGNAAYRMLGDRPLVPNENGMVVVPEERRQAGGVRGVRTITGQQAADEGWAVVGLNYDEGRNLLPPPSEPEARANGTGSGGRQPATGREAAPPAPRTNTDDVAGPDATGPARSTAPDPADAPIDTDEVMGDGRPVTPGGAMAGNDAPPLPEGVRELPTDTFDGRTSQSRIDTSERGPSGEMIFRDGVNGGYTATTRDGRNINAASLAALRAALRGL